MPHERKTVMHNKLAQFLAVLVFVNCDACSKITENNTQNFENGDTDADSETTGNGAGDGDADGDADADADNDADTDADGDADGDADSDIDTNVDTATTRDSESDSSGIMETGGDSDTGNESDTASFSDSEPAGDSGGDSDTDHDSASDGDTDSDTDSDTDNDTDTDTDTDTDIDSDSDGETASETDTGFDATSDSNEICVQFGFDVERVPTRVVISLDRSGTMDDNNKWGQALAAIENLLNNYQDKIEFGLDLFSIEVIDNPIGNNGCTLAEVINTDTAPHNAENIMSVLSSFEPGHATPLYLEIKNFYNASYAPDFMTDFGDKYLLIISDGMDNCGTTGVVQIGGGATNGQLANAVKSIRDNMDIKTIAIGFGDGADPMQLNAIAEVGGTEFTTYFDADDGTALDAAMESIAGTVAVGCSFDIGAQDTDEVDLDLVNLRFDGEPIPRDDDCAAGQGWKWKDALRTTIELCEQACDTLKSGAVSAVAGEIACSLDDVVVIVV